MILLGTRVLVQPIKQENESILLLETDKKQNKGHVVLVSDKTKHVKVGDTVVYYDQSGINIEYRGDDLLLLEEGNEIGKGDIIAVL